MSRGWEKSNLIFGEELKIPKALFIEPDKAIKRLESVNYVGENKFGIMIDCVFRSSFATSSPKGFHYRMMINWASIWCGHIKIHRKDGEQVFARRKKGEPVAIGQYKGGYQF